MLTPLLQLGTAELKAVLHAAASDSRVITPLDVNNASNLTSAVLQLEATADKAAALVCRLSTQDTAEQCALLLGFLMLRHSAATMRALDSSVLSPPSTSEAKLGLVVALRRLPARELVLFSSLISALARAAALSTSATVLSLALRDCTWALAALANDAVLGEHASALASLVATEASWVPSPSLPLRVALADLHSSLACLSPALQLVHLRSVRGVLARRGRWPAADNSTAAGATNAASLHLSLRRACLAMGYGAEPPAEVRGELLEQASAVMRDPRLQQAKSVAVLCVRCLVKAKDVDALVAMLDEKDAAAHVAVEIVADAAFDEPSRMLALLGPRLDADKDKRELALAVVVRIVELRSARASTSDVDVHLASLLLARLEDDAVDVRNAAARVFAQVDPDLVVPALVPMLVDSRDKTRSAAQAALEGVLGEHRDTAAAFASLLQSIAKADKACVERVALLKAWPSRVPATAWPVLSRVLVDGALADASSALPLLRGVGARVAPHQSARVVELVASARGDTLQRLAPLLVLSALLPLDAAVTEAAADALAARMADATELADVRALAAQLLARLPGAAPWAVLLRLLEGGGQRVRAALAGACHAVARAVDEGLDADLCCPPMLPDLVWRIADGANAGDDDERTKQGCAELLGLCVAAGLDAGVWRRLLAQDNNGVALGAVESALRRLPAGPARQRLCRRTLLEASAQPRLAALCFLAAYLVADSGLADAAEAARVFGNAVHALAAAEAGVDAVKFLGALLAWPMAVLERLPPGHLASARLALVGASNVNANAEARALAAQLVATCFV